MSRGQYEKLSKTQDIIQFLMPGPRAMQLLY
jgi:hypothetical protein